MKPFIKFTLLPALLVALCSCTSKPYEPHPVPPDAFNPVFLRYKEAPGQKVMAVAVDPTGQWAFGYDDSKATVHEATTNAVARCNKARGKHNVFTKPKIFAINDEIIYYKDPDNSK